jgi:hypothetical protein
MAVIGATQIEPVNILGSYVQGRELGRANQLARQQEMERAFEVEQQQKIQNALAGGLDIRTPEGQAALMKFGPQGLAMAAQGAQLGQYDFQAKQAERAAAKERLGELIGILRSGEKDDASYAAAYQTAQARGFDMTGVPTTRDPAYIQSQLQSLIPLQKQLELEISGRTADIQRRQIELAERKQTFEERGGVGGMGGEKPPQGYRWTEDRKGLQPIPGGPADTKNQQKVSELEGGREEVNTQVATLRDFYKRLDEMKAITSVRRSRTENIRAAAESSELGQAAGRAVGSEAQSIRNSIKQQRPLLLQAIKRATGMTSKQMDSNVELQLYLSAATDPTLDIDANLRALENLDRLYGLGEAGPSKGGPTSRGRGSPKPASNVDALLEKYKE